MNLFEYIKSQLPSMPNASIMKDMGASEELIKYVKETPENTNLGMMKTYGCEESSGDEEVTLWSGEVAARWNDKAPSLDYSIIGIEDASVVKVGDTVIIELSDGTKATNTVANKYDNGTFDFGYPPIPGNFPSGMIGKNDSWYGSIYIDKNGYTADTAPQIVKFSYIAEN